MGAENIYERLVSGIKDPQEAIDALGFRDAVIKKFGAYITPEQFYNYVRGAVLGPVSASETIQNHDSKQTIEAILMGVGNILRTSSAGYPAMMFHPDITIRSFGQRMYLELNPDDLPSDRLDEIKKEWQRK